MTSNFSDGQTFPTGFRLDREISRTPAADIWVCTNEQTGERVLARFFQIEVTDNWPEIVQRLNAVRGLVHENINLPQGHGEQDGFYFVLEPYIASASHFGATGDESWPSLKQLIDVLDYLHQLGISHGNLHPGNLLVDTQGNLHVTGIGVPANIDDNPGWFSPQVASGQAPDPSDDIYSLGCLLRAVLTGTLDTQASAPATPLPDAVAPLINQMTSQSSFDRTAPLAEVRRVLNTCFDDPENQITATLFTRSGKSEDDQPTEIPVTGRSAKSVSTTQVVLGFLAILLIALGLFTLLPTDPAPAQQTSRQPAASADVAQSQPTTRQSQPEEITITPFEAARLEHLRQEGEAITREILRLQLSLEDQGVMLWASESYAIINLDLDAAESLFRERKYDAALDAYKNVRASMGNLAATIPDVFQAEIERGDRALAQGDHQQALEAFTVANAISPDDEQIDNKLGRAENLQEVLQLVRQAEMLEREQNLIDARSVFEQARQLDPGWQPAADGVSRTDNAIRMENFRTAMSAAFDAISRQNYDLARTRLGEAQDILPDSTEPADGLQQVAQAETNDRINEIRSRAEAHVGDQSWELAIDAYESALAISNSLQFAIEGVAVASSRLELDKQLVRYLSDPPLLHSDEELSNASSALRNAMRIQTPDQDLSRRIDSLAKLISTARIEIPVTIRSDGRTSVTVRKHAHLGNITSQVVFLIPGRYTITGERSGYRDVRRDLVLVAGRPIPEVVIETGERVR